MAHGIYGLIWLRILLMEMGFCNRKPMVLYCDNTSAEHIVKNPVYHKTIEHIEVE